MHIFNSNKINNNLHLAHCTRRYRNRLRHIPAVFHQLQLQICLLMHKLRFDCSLMTQLRSSSSRLHLNPRQQTRPRSLLCCTNRSRIHTGSQSCLHRGLLILDNLRNRNTECWRLLEDWRRNQIKATSPEQQRFKIKEWHTKTSSIFYIQSSMLLDSQSLAILDLFLRKTREGNQMIIVTL